LFSNNRSLLVLSDAEPGTSQFSCYLAASKLDAGAKVVFVETNTPPDEVVFHISNYGIDTSGLESEGRFAIVDACRNSMPVEDPNVVKVGDAGALSEIFEAITVAVNRLGGKDVEVIFDSLTPLYSSHDTPSVARFFKDLSTIAKFNGSLTCAVDRSALGEEQTASIASVADGLMEMTMGSNLRWYVRLKHLRGSVVSPKWIPLDMEREPPVGTALMWRRGSPVEADFLE
jgi:KaiC/GvpD/RAD55 family RecA-like ATPase